MDKTSTPLGECPDCGANMDMVGRAHNCRQKWRSAMGSSAVMTPLPKKRNVAIAKKIASTVAPASHPDCERCKANRKATAVRMRKARAKP